MNIFSNLNTIDRRALVVALVFVGIFITYVSSSDARTAFYNFGEFIGGSNVSTKSPDLYCSKKENRNRRYCLDRKIAVNDRWSDVVHRSQDTKKSTAFALTK